MCMYTCTCMSCIYSMSWIHRYMYIFIPSPSRHHLACCQRQIFNNSNAMMVICLIWFLWTPPPHPKRSHVRQPRVPPRHVRHSSDAWEEKSNFLFRRGKNRDFETKGVWPVPSRGTTTGMGSQRKSRQRDGSHKRSRNHSRKLRERTPLVLAAKKTGNFST